MPPGSTVLFHAGQSWTENLTPSCSGDAGLPITFSSYGSGAKPILDGTGLNGDGINVTGRAYLSFSKLEVSNDPMGFCISLQSVDHLTFDQMNLHNCAEGINATAVCDNVTVTNATMHDFAASGSLTNNNAIRTAATCHSWLVTDSDLSVCDQDCVSDPSVGSTWQRVHAHGCGASCFTFAANGTRLEQSQMNSCVASAVRLQSGASGVYYVRRNEAWDSNLGFEVQSGSTADTRLEQSQMNSCVASAVRLQSGAMNNTCNAAVDSYCDTAPEPGAVEIP
jgi:hypothetical protein